jgi:hypothetical protein
MAQILLLGNPGKRKHRRKAKAKRRSARRRSHSRKRSHVRVRARRNPSPSVRGITGSVVPTIKNGAIGAVGGLMNDLAYGFGKGYLPVSMQSGMGRHAVKILSSVLIGVAGNFVMRGKGGAFAVGAATVAIHEALKEQLATMVPTLPLGAMDEQPGMLGYSAGEVVDGYDSDTIGEYIGDGMMGEYLQPGGIGDGSDGGEEYE